MNLPPAERERLDAYSRTMRTLLCALFFVALLGNTLPRVPENAQPFEVLPASERP